MLSAIDTPIHHNAIIVLDGLKPTDMQVDYLMSELIHLHHYREGKPIKPGTQRIEVRTRARLLQALGAIAQACRQTGLQPILHLECHGGADVGITLGAEQEVVSWDELTALLRHINVGANCNLGVVMAGCHGMAAIEPVTLDMPTPFLWLVGHDEIVAQGDLRIGLPRFYQTLWRTGELTTAVAELEDFRWYNAERFLHDELDALHKSTGSNRRATALTDQLLLRLSVKFGELSPEDLSERRRRVKAAVRNTVDADSLEEIAQLFLGPTRRPFSYTHLVERLRTQIAPRVPATAGEAPEPN
ncbi:hypothetical protein [Cupriavidus pampae]|jgi:hypothetical protein|uniref:Uncharacterized protein n=1 Tax=Cupriavidus pampae TaxID=659251 RepID=A0ABM8XUB7_9BURK|nr:hypothetical protein [Cupriavidus pampae]CAG9183954.1 hypothetical protein LMG32289_05471 [Cupriavidus pampae]